MNEQVSVRLTAWCMLHQETLYNRPTDYALTTQLASYGLAYAVTIRAPQIIMAKHLSAAEFANWYSKATHIDFDALDFSKEIKFTRRDGTEDSEFVTVQKKAKAFGVTVVDNEALGMKRAIVTLDILRAERLGDSRFQELKASAKASGDYSALRSYVGVPGVANESRSCFPELSTVQGEREVTIHFSKRTGVDKDGVVNTYFNIEVDAVAPLPMLKANKTAVSFDELMA